jgi:hypothetical protein
LVLGSFRILNILEKKIIKEEINNQSNIETLKIIEGFMKIFEYPDMVEHIKKLNLFIGFEDIEILKQLHHQFFD